MTFSFCYDTLETIVTNTLEKDSPMPDTAIDNTDWSAVTRFVNNAFESDTLRVQVSTETETLTCVIPADRVEAFMKNLPFFEAEVTSN